MLLLCMSSLHAQYMVFKVKGAVEMSIDGKKWEPLKKNVELKESYQIRLHENSSIDIIDSKNLIYSCAEAKTLPVGDIVKQRKTILAAINEKSEKRKAIGGTERGGRTESLYLVFTETETFNIYDDSELLPEGAVFYITILNKTKDDAMVNVYQEFENGESTPCFPEDIWIENKSSIEIRELLFAKQANYTLVVRSKTE